MAHTIRITSADRHAGAISAFTRVFDAKRAPAVRRAQSLHVTLPFGSRRKLRRFIAASDKAREHDHATGARFGAGR